MDYRHRRTLERRAYPDPFLVAYWRRRTIGLLVAAVLLAGLRLYLPALLVAMAAIPAAVRYVRQQLALGALMAADGHRTRAELPATDLRVVYRRHR